MRPLVKNNDTINAINQIISEVKNENPTYQRLFAGDNRISASDVIDIAVQTLMSEIKENKSDFQELKAMIKERKSKTVTIKRKDGVTYERTQSEISGINTVSAHDKLKAFTDAIIVYNITESKKKEHERVYIYFAHQAFIARETSCNAARACKPFLAENKARFDEHLNSLNITLDCNKNYALLDVDDKKRMNKVTEILKISGIAKIFNR